VFISTPGVFAILYSIYGVDLRSKLVLFLISVPTKVGNGPTREIIEAL